MFIGNRWTDNVIGGLEDKLGTTVRMSERWAPNRGDDCVDAVSRIHFKVQLIAQLATVVKRAVCCVAAYRKKEVRFFRRNVSRPHGHVTANEATFNGLMFHSEGHMTYIYLRAGMYLHKWSRIYSPSYVQKLFI